MQLFKNYLASQRLKTLRKKRNIKVRTLTVSDIIRMSDLVELYAEELNIDSVMRLISSVQSKDENKPSTDDETVSKQVIAIGVEILKKVSTIGKTDVIAFFADLINVTPEDFKEMPIDTPLVIIDQIRTSPEAESFFIMQSLGSKLTELFDEPIGMLKAWFASTSEEGKNNS
jgi:DNA polymerase/3'-5' exonuclease PolX